MAIFGANQAHPVHTQTHKMPFPAPQQKEPKMCPPPPHPQLPAQLTSKVERSQGGQRGLRNPCPRTQHSTSHLHSATPDRPSPLQLLSPLSSNLKSGPERGEKKKPQQQTKRKATPKSGGGGSHAQNQRGATPKSQGEQTFQLKHCSLPAGVISSLHLNTPSPGEQFAGSCHLALGEAQHRALSPFRNEQLQEF